MKITYFTFDNYREYNYLPDQIKEKNFLSIELAVETAKKYFTPYLDNTIYPDSSLALDNHNIYHEVKEEYSYTKQITKKKSVEVKEHRIVTRPKFDYKPYGYTKYDFSGINPNQYSPFGGYRKYPDAEGYYLLKSSEVTANFDFSNKTLKWETPVFIQFYSADFVQTPEIKEPGKPYQAAKNEVLNEKAISDWLPIYWNKGNSWNKSTIFLTENGERYKWDYSLSITENNIEIVEELV